MSGIRCRSCARLQFANDPVDDNPIVCLRCAEGMRDVWSAGLRSDVTALRAENERLRAENERLRGAATEALAVLTRLADSAYQWAGRDVPVGLTAEIDEAKARLSGVTP